MGHTVRKIHNIQEFHGATDGAKQRPGAAEKSGVCVSIEIGVGVTRLVYNPKCNQKGRLHVRWNKKLRKERIQSM